MGIGHGELSEVAWAVRTQAEAVISRMRVPRLPRPDNDLCAHLASHPDRLTATRHASSQP